MSSSCVHVNVILFMHLVIYFGCVGSSLMGRFFSSCKEQGLLSAAAHGLPIAVAFLVAERSSGRDSFSSCSSRALEHRLKSCGTQA